MNTGMFLKMESQRFGCISHVLAAIHPVRNHINCLYL